MITIKHKGDFRKTERFLKRMKDRDFSLLLRKCGDAGVLALQEATPRDSGLTADSWSYEFDISKDGISIHWTNSNMNEGLPIALLVQYGHGTRGGTYIYGIDYINPALGPVFERFANEIWKEVQSA